LKTPKKKRDRAVAPACVSYRGRIGAIAAARAVGKRKKKGESPRGLGGKKEKATRGDFFAQGRLPALTNHDIPNEEKRGEKKKKEGRPGVD